MSFSTFFFFRQITLLTFFDYFILFFVDLHRKTSPTGLKRLNAAVESSQRTGKFFFYPFLLTFTGMSGQKSFFHSS